MNHVTKVVQLGLAVVVLVFSSAWAAEIRGTVVGVMDGDTLDVQTERDTLRVRLIGIDAPENGQPFGLAAKRRLSELAYAKPVSVVFSETDRYGRVLGRVVHEGQDVNAMLVAEGWAWAYRFRGMPTEGSYVPLERSAQAASVGLWREPGAIAPWEWRRGR